MKRLIILLSILSVITVGSFVIFDCNLTPLIRKASVQKARSVATYVISETVLEILDSENIDYDNIISLEKDNNGKIAAIKTNPVFINRLKSQISSKVYTRLNNIDEQYLSLKLGNVLNSGFFMGKGVYFWFFS